MYIGLVTGSGLPHEYFVWNIAERFGWTLEYIEQLPLARWHELIKIDDARAKAPGSLMNKWAK